MHEAGRRRVERARTALRPKRRLPILLFATMLAQVSTAQERTCSPDALHCCDAPATPAVNASEKPRFGVQVWPSSLAESASSVRYLIDLNPSDLRFSIGPNWRRQPPLDRDINDRDLDARVAAGFDTTKGLARQIENLRATQIALKARLHLIVWEPPPMPGEAAPSTAAVPAWRTLASENVALAARFQVAHLKALAAMGVVVDAMEVSNEPDGAWNIRISPADYAALIRAIRSEAARRKVALPKIYGPGASSAAATRTFFADPKTGKAILAAVDVLSLHVWDDKAGHDRFAEFDRLLADLKRLGPLPPIAVTEYGLAKPDPSAAGDRMNVTKRVADSIAFAPSYPPASLRDLLRLYGDRVETVLYWEFQDQSWSSGLFGLLGTDGRPKPIYDVYRRITALLAHQTAERVDAFGDGRLALIRGRNQSSIVLANPTQEAIDLVLPSGTALPAGAGACRTARGEPGIEVLPGAVETLPITLH